MKSTSRLDIHKQNGLSKTFVLTKVDIDPRKRTAYHVLCKHASNECTSYDPLYENLCIYHMEQFELSWRRLFVCIFHFMSDNMSLE